MEGRSSSPFSRTRGEKREKTASIASNLLVEEERERENFNYE